MADKKERTKAQIKAERTYAKKNANEVMIPRVRLISEDEQQLAKSVFELHGGTKKQAILDGLELLRNELNKQ